MVFVKSSFVKIGIYSPINPSFSLNLTLASSEIAKIFRLPPVRTSSNPSISDSKTSDGNGTGQFTSNLTALIQGTPYYVRAYASNSAGTAYGNELTFTTGPAQSGDAVTIQGMAFSPQTLTVALNITVTWTNNDGVTHTVTSDAAVFGSGNVAPGGTFSYQFTSTGTFPYHCSIHNYMTGTVIVQ